MSSPTAIILKAIFLDKSSLTLIASNFITIFVTILNKFSIGEIIWVYWFQNIIIGYFTWYRMSHLKKFTTKGLRADHQQANPTPETQRKLSNFFIFHYGFFHTIYFFALIRKGFNPFSLDNVAILPLLLFFIYSHYISYKTKSSYDLTSEPHIGHMMYIPYLRVFPMQCIVISILDSHPSAGYTSTLTLFLMLAMLADFLAHIFENWRHYLSKIYRGLDAAS